ncbi:MAG: HupE/UreJ family protein [Bacteroidota bacterium]
MLLLRSLFGTYLQLGFEHISDLQGYDHILFIIALCAIYNLKEWRKVAILVTAFTIGHSVTLALASFGIIPIRAALIEFLIPVTIVATALYNVIVHKKDESEEAKKTFGSKINLNYFFALIFGLIHGIGFSNFFKASLLPGEEESLLQQLLAFNIGVELGQLAIVAVILVTSYVAFNFLRIKQREWNLFISGAAAGIALIMAIERIPF